MENNLIPFDVEKALAGEPVVTRDGRPVTQVTKFKCPGIYPVAAVVGSHIAVYTIDGRLTTTCESYMDLFMAPKPKIKKGGWVNVYLSETRSDFFRLCSHIYESKELADKDTQDDFTENKRIACAYIEWEEEA